jgi:ABC-type uncharacterized transport system substrate-binding protein
MRRQASVIAATGGEPAPQVVKAATQTIPIVFMANGDPVAPRVRRQSHGWQHDWH